MNDFKGFTDTYPLYITLRDSSINRENQNAFLTKVSELEFEKKENSLKYQQQITQQKLQQQTLLSSQQQQALMLNQQKFALLGKEKDLQQLNYLKTQSDLLAEQNRRKANDQQLKVAEQKQTLDQTTLQLQKAEITSRRSQAYYFMAGIIALLVLSLLPATITTSASQTNCSPRPTPKSLPKSSAPIICCSTSCLPT